MSVEKTDDFDDDLKAMRRNYLHDLREDLDKMEALIMQITDASQNVEPRKHLARSLHSAKGTAGSYDLQLLSIALHRMEDVLLRQELTDDSDTEKVDELLRQKDLIESIVLAYETENDILLEDHRMRVRAVLQQEISPDQRHSPPQSQLTASQTHRVLLVEPTKTVVKLCVRALRSKSIEIATVRDGYEALGRLLTEHFDSVISSFVLPRISGTHLHQIIRLLPGPNQRLKFTLISSKQDSERPYPEPDYFLKKDAFLGEELERIYKNLLATYIRSFSPNQSRAAIESRPKKILVIDDSKDILILVRSAFKAHRDVEVFTLLDPNQAEQTVLEKNPDLVLLDAQMPSRSGLDVFKALTPLKEQQNFEMAFLTATTTPEEVSKLKALKPFSIFRKPFSTRTLAKQVFNAFKTE